MNRRRWFVGKKMAAWCCVLLLVLLAADLYANRLADPDIISAAGEPSAAERAAAKQTEAGTKTVALTFDDGPHPVWTPKLLDGLRKRHVHASFFLIGQNIDGNEEIVRQMYKDGHLIGNHSQSHMQLTAEHAEDACAQIRRTNEKIKAVTGHEPDYVRPPFGSWSDELEELVPMTAVLWNLDPLDWKSQDRASVVAYVKSHVEDGSIILLHDVYEPSVEAALEIVDMLLAEDYNFVTVDEMLIE